ncbi:MAG: protein-disulfide reductase DsbD family protein, partial [Gammaproteobacteria bacterium]|nr:protein-disulfide reductase DsbD family protein [Gammaproteobacteria bacterium]
MLHNTVIPKLLSLFVLFFIAGALQAEDEPLMPNEAFKFSAKMIDANTARVEWNVVKKYYLYRDKISFSSGTPGIDIGTVSLPKGKLKHGIRPDGSEGEVETFIGKLTINVPLRRTNPNLKEFTLIAKSQGCAEIGICYPPHKQQATLKLPAAGNNKTSAVKQINTLSNLLGVSNNQDILTADEAFQVNVTAEDGNTIVARWVIAPKHYMYRDKINVKLKDVSGVRLADVVIPAGEEKHDEVFKKTMQVFHDHAEARIKLARSKTEPMDIALELTWQGCAEEVGICYPPVKKQLTVSLPAGGSAAPAAASGESTFSMERFNRILDQGNLLLVMLATMAAGIILAFTACMYPMIPILSSIIVGQGEKATAAKGLGLSLIYVGSMAVTFGVIGAIMAGVSGGVGLQAYFQSPWMLIPFA